MLRLGFFTALLICHRMAKCFERASAFAFRVSVVAEYQLCRYVLQWIVHVCVQLVLWSLASPSFL